MKKAKSRLKRTAHNKGKRRVRNSLTRRDTYVDRDRFAGFHTLLVFILGGLLTSLVSCHRFNPTELKGTSETESRQPTSNPNPTPEPQIDILYSGKVSYYSHEGCLGCGEEQRMGNGEYFDENAMTLAVPCEDIISGKYKYGTEVRVINQDNYMQEEATITDCGGFSKYNRVADLSKGLYEALEAKTDKTEVVIYTKE
jgi:hypothetical protein